MELMLETDIYQPFIGENGAYIDSLPTSNKFKNGVRCPCGARKDHVFDTRSSFASHIKTQTHIKWLANLNANKMNYYAECEKLKEVVNSQKLIIAQLEKDINALKREVHTKSRTIDILTEQLTSHNSSTVDLLEFD